MRTLLSLPEEILLHIISYLPKRDVLRLLLVCKFFNDFISNSSKALENVRIRFVSDDGGCIIDEEDEDHDYSKLLVRKYSNLGFKLGYENLELMPIIGPQLRILKLSGHSCKLSHLIKILKCCNYLKEFKYMEQYEMKVGNIELYQKDLPAISINKVTIGGETSALYALTKCKIKSLRVIRWNPEWNDEFVVRHRVSDQQAIEPLRTFLQSHKNLEVLQTLELIAIQLDPEIIPTHLKELKLDSFEASPRLFYDFSKFVEFQKLQKMVIVFGTEKIEAYPSLNQLSRLQSLKHLSLKARELGNFKDMNVMENVQFLTIDFHLGHKIYGSAMYFLAEKFPNLKYLRATSVHKITFLGFLKFALMLIVGDEEIILPKIPSVVNDLCLIRGFSEYKVFIKCQKVENSRESKITKKFSGANKIELELTVGTGSQIIEMKIFMLKEMESYMRKNYRRSNLTSIDGVILSEILSYLDIEDILNLRLVCKELNESMTKLPKFMSESQFEQFLKE